MREYFTDKKKKAMLEEFLIEKLKDYKTVDGSKIINVDILTLISGNLSGMYITYESDILGQDKYSTGGVRIIVEDGICQIRNTRSSLTTKDLFDPLFISFIRELKLNKLINGN